MDWQQQIVMVSPFFFPEQISTGKANRHLAEALVAEGHGVTVVCSHPLYPTWVPSYSDAKIQGTKILRGGAWVRYPKAMPLRRLVLEAWFALYSLTTAWKMRKQADVVVGILPPSLFAYLLHLAFPRRVRRVAVIHDLQGVLAAQKESLPRRAIIRLIHAVEQRAFRSQDLCVFFSEDMARVAQHSYKLDSAKIAVQYPFVTLLPDQIAQAPAKTRLAAILPPEKLHVVYSGALGYKQNSRQLVQFLQAAATMYPQVGFHVFSGGPFFQELRAEAARLPEPKVQFHPLVEEEDLAELYARSTIQIIPQAEGTEAAALPSKLPNLLAAGVSMLAICEEQSEVGRLMRQAGTGSIVERWDEALFLERLGQALALAQGESPSARRARVAPLLELFSLTNMVRQVLGGSLIQMPVSLPPRETERQPEPMRSGARG